MYAVVGAWRKACFSLSLTVFKARRYSLRALSLTRTYPASMFFDVSPNTKLELTYNIAVCTVPITNKYI